MIGNSQARRLASDGAGLDHGAESLRESSKSLGILPRPSPPSSPRNNMNDKDAHMQSPEDNFGVFELPRRQGADLYATSISFRLFDLGRMTCSLLVSLSPFVKRVCNNDIYFIGLF